MKLLIILIRYVVNTNIPAVHAMYSMVVLLVSNLFTNWPPLLFIMLSSVIISTVAVGCSLAGTV